MGPTTKSEQQKLGYLIRLPRKSSAPAYLNNSRRLALDKVANFGKKLSPYLVTLHMIELTGLMGLTELERGNQ